MTQPDNTSRAYELADEWISIVLSTQPELLVGKVHTTQFNQQTGADEFDFNNAVHRARALAEFRQQLANALSAQHFTQAPGERS